LLGSAVALWSPRGTAEPDRTAGAMTYVYNAPESSLDVRYDYHWEILRTALDKTRPSWGEYRMVRSETMSERRQVHELESATGKLSVMYLGTTPEFEHKLVGIHIPVDRNLGGYSVLLVRRDRAGEFSNIHSVGDLRRVSFGLGLGWIDVDILRHNGLRVVTGSSYDGLFEMLVHRRFDALLRAAVEVLDEQAQRKATMPDLYIEPSLVLYYPLPMYFWFARNEQGARLARRAEEGMRMMIADGTYDRIFDKHQRRKIETLDLKHRTILRIENPFVGAETPFADTRLWFDPESYR
jgi:ABC-type amino acid transport substrate-binding protein